MASDSIEWDSIEWCALYCNQLMSTACGNKPRFHINGMYYVGWVEIPLPNGSVYHLPMKWHRYTGMPTNVEEYPTYYYYRLVVRK